jgi:hypothetical protein
MTMPEAAVYKNDFALLGEDDVGISRHISFVESKAIAQSVDNRTNKEFGLGIQALNPGHDPTSFFFVKNIHLILFRVI